MRDMAKSLQQLQQQAEKLGKDLAEQLKNGQPELAQATLQKMVVAIAIGQSLVERNSRRSSRTCPKRLFRPATTARWPST